MVRFPSFLPFVGSIVSSRSLLDLFVARVNRVVVHSWEMSASDMFLGVAESANRGGPMPSTREDVLNVPWNEENCPQSLDATSFPSGAS